MKTKSRRPLRVLTLIQIELRLPDIIHNQTHLNMSALRRVTVPELKIPFPFPKLPIVYCAYAWSESLKGWMLIAFIRVKRSIRIKDFETHRRRFTIPDNVPFKLIELFCAQNLGAGPNPHDEVRRLMRRMKLTDLADRKTPIRYTRRRPAGRNHK